MDERGKKKERIKLEAMKEINKRKNRIIYRK